MIDNIINEMLNLSQEIQNMLEKDLEDVKVANHEGLLSRNDIKLEKMYKLVDLKQDLNMELAKALEDGVDLNIYRDKVDILEDSLYNMYDLNNELAKIVLPLKEMYDELVEEISKQEGNLVNLKA